MDEFIFCTFKANKNLAGQVKASFIVQAFDLQPHRWGDFIDLKSSFMRLSFLIQFPIYFMVVVRMQSEYSAFKKIRKRNRSFTIALSKYLNGLFTQLELVNLSANWIVLALRIYTIMMPERRKFDLARRSNFTDFSAMDKIAAYAAATMSVQAFSIMTSCFLFFKYLTLMPKTSSWYLTGTALNRAGVMLKPVFICLFIFLVAWAIVLEHAFGTVSAPYSSLPQSFVSAFSLLAGNPVAVRSAFGKDNQPLKVIYFVCFYASTMLLLVPLFLVVMRDAFVVRNDQLIVLRARLKVEREMKENKLEEEQKRKRGGFH